MPWEEFVFVVRAFLVLAGLVRRGLAGSAFCPAAFFATNALEGERALFACFGLPVVRAAISAVTPAARVNSQWPAQVHQKNIGTRTNIEL